MRHQDIERGGVQFLYRDSRLGSHETNRSESDGASQEGVQFDWRGGTAWPPSPLADSRVFPSSAAKTAESAVAK
jgi:hypothetical protein